MKKRMLCILICTAMLLGMLPQAAFAAVTRGEISEMEFTVTPPAIGEKLDFNVTVGNDSAYTVSWVEWYRVWGTGSEQRYTTPIEAQVDGEYYALLYIEAVGLNVIPEDLSELTVSVNGRCDNVKLERESGIDTVYCYVYFDKLFYTVSFSANGGTGTMDNVAVYDDTYTAPECGFTPPHGMAFNGWTVDGTTGRWYFPNSELTLGSDVTLYAKWADPDPSKTYTLTFEDFYVTDPETGTYPTYEVTVNGGAYVLPESLFEELEFYEFDYWGIDLDGDNNWEKYYPGDTIYVYSDLLINIIRTDEEIDAVTKAVFSVTCPEGFEYKNPADSVAVTIADAPNITLCGGYGEGYWIRGVEQLSATDPLSTDENYSLFVKYRVDEGYYHAINENSVKLIGDPLFDGITPFVDPTLQEDGSYTIHFELPPVKGTDITDDKIVFSIDGYEKGSMITGVSADTVTDHFKLCGSGYGRDSDGYAYLIWRDAYSYGNAVYDGSGVFESARDYYISIYFSLEDGYSLPDEFLDGRRLNNEKLEIDGIEGEKVYMTNRSVKGYYVVFQLPQLEAEPIEEVALTLSGVDEGEYISSVTLTYPDTLEIPAEGYYSHYIFYDDSYHDFGIGGDFAGAYLGAVFEKGITYRFAAKLFPKDGYSAENLKKENVTLTTSLGTCVATRLEYDSIFRCYWVTFDLPMIMATVSFDGDGALGTMTDVRAYGVYILPKCGYIAPNTKTFSGWSIDGKLYRPGETVLILDDTVITAVWSRAPLVTYTVAFNANGGSGTMNPVRGVVGEYTLPPCNFLPPDGMDVFVGWRLNDTRIVLVPGTTIGITGDTVFSAMWKARDFSSYTVSFNVNGGDGLYGPVAGVSGTYTLPECVFTPPAGKQFKAWEVGGVQYAPGDKITVLANKKVYAVWEDIYVVNFFGNGGEGAMAPVVMTAGEYILPECSFEAPAGAKFKAWRGLSCDYAPGDVIDVSSNFNFLAVYEATTFYVTLTGTVKGFGGEDEKTTVTLTRVGETSPLFETELSGNTASFRFPYIVAGEFVLKVTKAKHVEYTATVVLTSEDVVHNVDLEYLLSEVIPGDVNLDGIINSIDSNLLRRIVASAYTVESGSPQALAADFNGDGAINSIDSNLLKRKIAGK